MLEESVPLVRLRELCRTPVVTCSPEDDIVSAATTLDQSNSACVIVCEDERPLGIITDSDLRKAIVKTGGSVGGRRARDIMSAPLVTIRREDYAFEAIYKMSKHHIHRLVVLDEEDRPFGIVTDADVVALYANTPLYLSGEIEAARTLQELRNVNESLLDVVSFANRAGTGTRDIVRLIAHFNDAITRRVIALIDASEGLALPARAAYLVLGSEGRNEQTLRTDQDSAAVYADDLPPGELRALEAFTCRLIEALVEIGVPPCPGRTMANNPLWRRSLSDWMRALDQWLSVLKPEHMVNFGMFQDLRTVHGDPTLEQQLKAHIRDRVGRNALFLPYVARNIVRFTPPLGLFGRLRVERSGDHKGLLDIKKAGIFAVTEGVSLLALEAGVQDGSTWDKIDALRERKVLPEDELGRLGDAFTFLVRLRLRCQLEALANGRRPSKWIDPLKLSGRDIERLKEAFVAIGAFLRSIRERYKLDFISR